MLHTSRGWQHFQAGENFSFGCYINARQCVVARFPVVTTCRVFGTNLSAIRKDAYAGQTSYPAYA
jgi:hypothetical protein